MDNLMQNMIEKEAARLNTANMNLVKSLEQTFELEGLVFMDMVQENELPQDNMTYFIIENGDFNNNITTQKKFLTETVTITFWNENRENPTLDRLIIMYIAKQCGLNIVASDNQNIILTGESRIVNMFTLTCSRGVKLQGVC